MSFIEARGTTAGGGAQGRGFVNSFVTLFHSNPPAESWGRESDTFYDALSLVAPERKILVDFKLEKLHSVLRSTQTLHARCSDGRTFSMLQDNLMIASVQFAADGVEILDCHVEGGFAAAAGGIGTSFSAGFLASRCLVVASQDFKLILIRPKKAGKTLDPWNPGELRTSILNLKEPAVHILFNPDQDLIATITATEVHFLGIDEWQLSHVCSTPLPASKFLHAAWVPQKPRTLRIFAQDQKQQAILTQTLLMPDNPLTTPGPQVGLIIGPTSNFFVQDKVTAVSAASHDPDLCAVACEDGSLTLIDLRGCLALRQVFFQTPLLSLSFHPVGGVVVGVRSDGFVHCCDLALHKFEMQRELGKPQEGFDFRHQVGSVQGSPTTAWIPPNSEAGAHEGWLEGTAESMTDSLLISWPQGPAAVLALDLGPVAGGRWGLQEVCAYRLSQGQWKMAEELVWSCNGRQRQVCASLLVHWILKVCFRPGYSAGPAAQYPDPSVRIGKSEKLPTTDETLQLLSRISQLAQDSSEGMLATLVSDSTRRIWFWALGQGDWELCEALAMKREEEDLLELLIVWAKLRGKTEVVDRVYEKFGDFSRNPGGKTLQYMRSSGLWEQEVDRRAMKEILTDPQMIDLLEYAMQLDDQFSLSAPHTLSHSDPRSTPSDSASGGRETSPEELSVERVRGDGAGQLDAGGTEGFGGEGAAERLRGEGAENLAGWLHESRGEFEQALSCYQEKGDKESADRVARFLELGG